MLIATFLTVWEEVKQGEEARIIHVVPNSSYEYYFTC